MSYMLSVPEGRKLLMAYRSDGNGGYRLRILRQDERSGDEEEDGLLLYEDSGENEIRSNSYPEVSQHTDGRITLHVHGYSEYDDEREMTFWCPARCLGKIKEMVLAYNQEGSNNKLDEEDVIWPEDD